MSKDNTYFVVHRWMSTKLGLSGCERDVYAIIYGFSQDGDSDFHGSLPYLKELCGYSVRRICEALSNLTAQKILIKHWNQGDKCPTYKANLTMLSKALSIEDTSMSMEEISMVDLEETSNNNKEDNNKDIINTSPSVLEDNGFIKSKRERAAVDHIIGFLNSTCGTKFKTNTSATKKAIKARIKEGFSLQDFEKVILWKYEQWGKKPVRFSNGQMSDTYLRPDTLFGNKFESYLYEANQNNINSEGEVKEVVKPLTGKVIKEY